MRRYAYFALSLSVTIFALSFVTGKLSSQMVQIAVAGAVILFSLYNLAQRPFNLSQKRDKQWQIFFGAMAGIMGAITSMWAVPLVMYLLSRKLNPKEFVDAAGFLLLVGCVPLSVGYVATGLSVTSEVLIPAIAGTIGSLSGFQLLARACGLILMPHCFGRFYCGSFFGNGITDGSRCLLCRIIV